MLGRFARVMGAIVVVALGVGYRGSSPASAATGDSPAEAVEIPNNNFNRVLIFGPGEARWLRIDYPGGDAALAITLHLRPEDRDVGEFVNAYLNVGTRGETQGEPNRDFPGLSRLGVLGRTAASDTGDDRKFWLSSHGERENYYLLIRNQSDRRVPAAISVWRLRHPEEYIYPTFEAASRG